jgi:hypothetical protein
VGKCARARPRLAIAQISVRFVAEGVEALGQLHNVSRSGLYVRSVEPPRPGAIVALQFESPVGRLVDLRGEVRWNTRGAARVGRPEGFGVRLHEPPRVYSAFVLWAQSSCEKPDDDKALDEEL